MKKAKKIFAMHDDYHISGEPSPSMPEATEPEAGISSAAAPFELSAQMDQVVRGLSGVQSGGQVYLVGVRQLEPYPDQPFKRYPPERLNELAEDISRVGVLNPILTRRHKNKLQILAGHNRWSAAKLAGLSQVPVLILDVDDDQAVLVLTSTNLRQREHLTPSEKAFAYKLQMDALKRQGQRAPDGGDPRNAADYITRQTGDSRMQIHRYIRLTELEPELLELLDNGKISMTPAVAVSYLKPEAQREVLHCIREFGARLTIEKAERLRAMVGADSPPTVRQIEDLLLQNAKKSKLKYISISYRRVKDFLPEDIEPDEMEEFIIEALKRYRR